MAPCPHCGHPAPEDSAVCPRCGGARVSAWPPPPDRPGGVPSPRPSDDTGSAAGGFLLGMGVGFAWWSFGASLVVGGNQIRPLVLLDLLLFAPSALVNAVAWFLLRPARPGLARGLGYSVLTLLALTLGAVALCH